MLIILHSESATSVKVEVAFSLRLTVVIISHLQLGKNARYCTGTQKKQLEDVDLFLGSNKPFPHELLGCPCKLVNGL